MKIIFVLLILTQFSFANLNCPKQLDFGNSNKMQIAKELRMISKKAVLEKFVSISPLTNAYSNKYLQYTAEIEIHNLMAFNYDLAHYMRSYGVAHFYELSQDSRYSNRYMIRSSLYLIILSSALKTVNKIKILDSNSASIDKIGLLPQH